MSRGLLCRSAPKPHRQQGLLKALSGVNGRVVVAIVKTWLRVLCVLGDLVRRGIVAVSVFFFILFYYS